MATGDQYEGGWEAGKKNGRGTFEDIQDSIFLRTETFTRGNSRTVTGRDRANILGLTRATTRGSGWLTR